MPERTVEEVVGLGNYVQIEEGLTDAMAHEEARRCLRCDVCIGCGLCMAACSEMGVDALRMADTDAGRVAYFDFTRPAGRCIGCGACSQVCPTGAIRIEDEVDLSAGAAKRDLVRRTIITGTTVCEQPLLTCSECGAPTQTPAHREFIRGRLPDHMAALLDRELCPSCARLQAERPGPGPRSGRAAAGHPKTTWCVTVTDQDGHAIGHGCARPEPRNQHGPRINGRNPGRRTGATRPAKPETGRGSPSRPPASTARPADRDLAAPDRDRRTAGSPGRARADHHPALRPPLRGQRPRSRKQAPPPEPGPARHLHCTDLPPTC